MRVKWKNAYKGCVGVATETEKTLTKVSHTGSHPLTHF